MRQRPDFHLEFQLLILEVSTNFALPACAHVNHCLHLPLIRSIAPAAKKARSFWLTNTSAKHDLTPNTSWRQQEKWYACKMIVEKLQWWRARTASSTSTPMRNATSSACSISRLISSCRRTPQIRATRIGVNEWQCELCRHLVRRYESIRRKDTRGSAMDTQKNGLFSWNHKSRTLKSVKQLPKKDRIRQRQYRNLDLSMLFSPDPSVRRRPDLKRLSMFKLH